MNDGNGKNSDFRNSLPKLKKSIEHKRESYACSI